MPAITVVPVRRDEKWLRKTWNEALKEVAFAVKNHKWEWGSHRSGSHNACILWRVIWHLAKLSVVILCIRLIAARSLHWLLLRRHSCHGTYVHKGIVSHTLVSRLCSCACLINAKICNVKIWFSSIKTVLNIQKIESCFLKIKKENLARHKFCYTTATEKHNNDIWLQLIARMTDMFIPTKESDLHQQTQI